MDGRGGCCIARYDGGAYDTSKIDRIMLRFRPIAPKPAVGGGSVSGGSSPEKNDFLNKSGRAKRKYVRDGSSTRRCSRKKKAVSVSVSVSGSEQRKDGLSEDAVVTLLLLPEKPVEKDTPTTRSPCDADLSVGTKAPLDYVPTWLKSAGHHQERTVVMPQPVRPVGSCVIVECVTDVCGGEDGSVGLGRGDGEKRTNLERDTCPGLISDGLDRVEWTNEAYRKLVGQDDDDDEGDDQVRPEMVWLVMKERVPETCASFTCRVRVQYTSRKERYSLTVPCDVWRMNCGWLAWRLDVKAALSLGR